MTLTTTTPTTTTPTTTTPTTEAVDTDRALKSKHRAMWGPR